ncbi:MAG TPA: DUF4190 domain-containing protein [Candidatus Sulfotelmatobacter sp.]|nr:DUF4190 domain-containing protein [Candidatus Sulfotelmatobacter sp.]
MGKFCAACGNSMNVEDRFCRVCGRAADPGGPTPGATVSPAVPVSQETSGKAIVSLICGLFFFFFPLSVVAVILGHISLSDIRKSAGRLKGEGLAIAGLVFGYAGLAIVPFLIIAAIAIPNLLRARIAANESSAVASVRKLTTAEMTYAVQHPEEGYTCSLSSLEGANLIPADLAKGLKNGYAFEVSGCSSSADHPGNDKFQVVAYPIRVHQTGVRAFCADQTAVIRVDPGGSPQQCLEAGEELH